MRRLAALVLPASLLLPAPCAADAAFGTPYATARLQFRVIIPPVFKILHMRPKEGDTEIRVWTNTRSVILNNHEFRFNRVGEYTLRLPNSADPGIWIVHGL